MQREKGLRERGRITTPPPPGGAHRFKYTILDSTHLHCIWMTDAARIRGGWTADRLYPRAFRLLAVRQFPPSRY